MKILVTGRLPEQSLALLKDHEIDAHTLDQPMDRKTLLAKIGDKHGLLCMLTEKIDEELIAAAPQLKMIANCAVGYDNIDLSAATAGGIPVSNTPAVLTDATADLTFALILAVARRVVEGDKRTRAGDFRFWAPMVFLGSEVSGKTLGIVGLGQIGQAVARRARGFDMRILYHKRTRVDPSVEKALQAEYVNLETLLTESDMVSLHVPLSPQTRHSIGPAELSLMKPSAFLINAARGPIVDEKALYDALKENRIAGAGLDVYENEPELTPGLTELDNVVLLPHVGSATIETRTKMANLAAKNLLAGLKGEKPPNCLNCKDLEKF